VVVFPRFKSNRGGLKRRNQRLFEVLYGVYDIIVIVETTTMQELKDVVGFKIRSLDKVHSTMTMIVVW